jgi:small conductance mechanosensitive channel
MDEEELYREENDPLAVFGHWESSKNWQNSTPTQKFEFLIKRALLLGGAVFIAAISYEAYHFGSNSAIVYILSGDWDRGIHIFSISAVIVLLILTALILKAFEHVANLVAAAFGSRVETMMHLTTALIKAGVIIVAGFYCLFLMGIEPTRLLASAGILSVVVGIGAQSLFSDLLAGIFIVMEGSLHVGDYIMIDGVRGKVVDIGLRITRFEDDNQNIRVICNNELKSFANMSMKYTIVYYNIPVPYGEDYQRIRKILNGEFLDLYEKNRFLKGIPVCQGIENFADHSVELRVKFMCDESERFDVQRFMHDQIMRVFMENDITIPFHQLDVHYEPLKQSSE